MQDDRDSGGQRAKDATVSSSAARVCTTRGFPSSAASSACASNTRPGGRAGRGRGSSRALSLRPRPPLDAEQLPQLLRAPRRRPSRLRADGARARRRRPSPARRESRRARHESTLVPTVITRSRPPPAPAREPRRVLERVGGRACRSSILASASRRGAHAAAAGASTRGKSGAAGSMPSLGEALPEATPFHASSPAGRARPRIRSEVSGTYAAARPRRPEGRPRARRARGRAPPARASSFASSQGASARRGG